MIVSGVDLLEIGRLERAFARHGQPFYNRIFTAQEQQYCNGRVDRLAGRFAVKEAVAKALGTGIGEVRWTDIEVVSNAHGKPELILYNKAYVIAEQMGVREWSISVSHTDTLAIGFATGISKDSTEKGLSDTKNPAF